MAKEITVTAELKLDGTLGALLDLSFTASSDSATPRMVRATQLIGTTEEQFAFVDVSSPRYVLLKNRDATNYVQAGAAAGQYMARLRPGDAAVIPLEGTTLFLKANTAACLVDIAAVNG